MLVSSLSAVSMAVLRSVAFAQSGTASVVIVLAMLALFGISSAQDSDGCASGIDVTSAPYGADPTGAADSSSAFNAAIVAAGGAGMLFVARGAIRKLVIDRLSWGGHEKSQRV